MSADACIVRPASDAKEAHAVYWPLIQILGWTRASEDCDTHYFSTGPNGFLLVADEKTPDKAEGMIVPVVFNNKTGWIGFFCLNEPVRGRGWGGKLFQGALDHFNSKGTEFIGLDAVAEQVNTYARRGFVEKGLVEVYTRPSSKAVPIDGLVHVPPRKRMIDIDKIPEWVLVQSDREHTGLERSRLWTKEALFDREDTFGFALVDEAKGHEKLDGWVVVRGCTIGFRLGPLVADSPEVASLLLKTVLKRVEDHDGQFIAELWSGNPLSKKVFSDAGFKDHVVTYHRMWLNGRVPEPQQPEGKADRDVYAIFDAGEG